MTDLTLLDAWIDGEPVAPDSVEALLATPEGRAYAVDVMALRCALRADMLVAPPVVKPAPRWRMHAAAAAAVVLTAAAGFMAGQYVTRDDGRTAVVGTAATTHDSAPAPTRVIQFEVGVDWSESSGGN
jgi:hypothetical protein